MSAERSPEKRAYCSLHMPAPGINTISLDGTRFIGYRPVLKREEPFPYQRSTIVPSCRIAYRPERQILDSEVFVRQTHAIEPPGWLLEEWVDKKHNIQHYHLFLYPYQSMDETLLESRIDREKLEDAVESLTRSVEEATPCCFIAPEAMLFGARVSRRTREGLSRVFIQYLSFSPSGMVVARGMRVRKSRIQKDVSILEVEVVLARERSADIQAVLGIRFSPETYLKVIAGKKEPYMAGKYIDENLYRAVANPYVRIIDS